MVYGNQLHFGSYVCLPATFWLLFVVINLFWRVTCGHQPFLMDAYNAEALLKVIHDQLCLDYYGVISHSLMIMHDDQLLFDGYVSCEPSLMVINSNQPPFEGYIC